MVDDGCSHRLGAGAPWSQATITEVALSSTTSSATPEPSAAFRRTRPVQPCSTDTCESRRQPRACTCEDCQAREGLGGDGESARGLLSRALKAELERTRDSAKRPPINVEVDECRKSIQRSEKRIRELDAERAAEAFALKEAKDRLQRLEVEQAQQPDPNAHPAPSVPRDWQAEMEALKAQLAHLEQERDEAVRVATRERGTQVVPCRASFLQSSTIGCKIASRTFKDAMIEGDWETGVGDHVQNGRRGGAPDTVGRAAWVHESRTECEVRFERVPYR